MSPRTRGGDISSAPRRRPTGSERRRRVQLREVEPAVDRDPVELHRILLNLPVYMFVRRGKRRLSFIFMY